MDMPKDPEVSDWWYEASRSLILPRKGLAGSPPHSRNVNCILSDDFCNLNRAAYANTVLRPFHKLNIENGMIVSTRLEAGRYGERPGPDGCQADINPMKSAQSHT